MLSFDRRSSLRLPVDLTVQWRRGWRRVMARAHDVSANGLFLLTDEVVETNHVLDLIVVLPSGPISFLAVSRFCGMAKWGHGIGAEIHAIAKPDHEAWARFYRERLERALRALPPSVVERIAR